MTFLRAKWRREIDKQDRNSQKPIIDIKKKKEKKITRKIEIKIHEKVPTIFLCVCRHFHRNNTSPTIPQTRARFVESETHWKKTEPILGLSFLCVCIFVGLLFSAPYRQL